MIKYEEQGSDTRSLERKIPLVTVDVCTTIENLSSGFYDKKNLKHEIFYIPE